MYILFEQCETIEGMLWRAIYGVGLKFRRVRYALSAPLYSKGSKALDVVGTRFARTCGPLTCLTAISSAVGASMGDMADTQQRAAACSGVALAM